MVWRKGGGSLPEEGRRLIAPTTASPLLSEGSPVVSLVDVDVQDNVCCAPACMSFVALPLLSTLSSSSSSSVQSASRSFGPSPAAALPPLIDCLLPSPFSSSSLSAFFPAHLATPHFVVASSSSSSPSPISSSASFLSFSPSVIRWRRGESGVKAPSSSSASDSVVKLSSLASLASLASSLPPFSTAEKAFVVDGKEDRKVKHDGGDGVSALWNLMPGNARFKKDAATFFKQLPSEFRRIQRRNYGRAAKRKAGDTFEAALSPENKKKAESIKEGQRKAIQTSKHLLAGAIAAMVSRTIVAPLERLKLEYLVRGAKGNVVNTVRNIFLTGGVKGFWKGNGANILRTAPFKSVNFFAYDTFRRQLLKLGDRTEVTNLERLAAGAAAGVTATILCFPLDTIRTLVVAPGGEALGGMRGCFQHLMRTEGFTALYKGLPAAVVSMAPSGAVFYGVYDILKTSYLSSPEGKEMLKARQKRAEERPEESNTQLELGTVRTLLFGAIAGACAETVTYPLEVVRRAQQMQFAGHRLGIIGTVQVILKKGGVRALYAGIIPSTVQVLPSAAISYFVYESVKIAFKIP